MREELKAKTANSAPPGSPAAAPPTPPAAAVDE